MAKGVEDTAFYRWFRLTGLNEVGGNPDRFSLSPEAPESGTLFKVLFLAAFLLFALTFGVNTLAELVRLRLRRKYRYL